MEKMFTILRYFIHIYICVCVCVCVCSQILQVRIINVEEYEKQENFFIVLEDPKWLKRRLSGECVVKTTIIMCDDSQKRRIVDGDDLA